MTTDGYLYNPNGEVGHDLKGHKDGNLRIDLLYIKERLMNHKDISMRYYNEKESYVEHLKKNPKRGLCYWTWFLGLCEFHSRF